MRKLREVLYEYKTVDVYSPPPTQETNDGYIGTAPYYLQGSLAQQYAVAHPTQSGKASQTALTVALQDAMAQQVAQGWEFVDVEQIELSHGAAYSPYLLNYATPAAGITYHLRFRRAKHP